jgi:Zn-dependent peptidase ImmA (M78 family)
MASFDRGFKSWAELTSLTIRRELDLAPHDPLDVKELARFLGVDVWTPHQVPGIPKDTLEQLLERDPWGWSAVSLLVDGRGLIIYNPRRSSGRKSSDISHELAHFIIGHEPSSMILSQDGSIAMRTFDRKQEDEANWLAWCLLIPREALIWCKRARLSVKEIAERYQVSESLVTFRLNISGVESQFASRRRRKA